MKVSRAVSVCVLTAAAMGATTGPAMARTPDNSLGTSAATDEIVVIEDPVPSEPVLDAEGGLLPQDPSEDIVVADEGAPNGGCVGKSTYTIISNSPNDSVITESRHARNDLPYDVSANFSITATKTTTFSVGLSVTAEAKALMFAKVSATINGSVQRALSSSVTDGMVVRVPAHKTVYGQYGIRREIVKFQRLQILGDCSSRKSTFFFKAPYSEGWRVW